MFRSISSRAARLGPALSVFALAATAQAQIGGHGSFEPAVLPDVNPAQAIVQVNLVAAPTTVQYIQGVPTAVYAYNGKVPGPTIMANVGDTLIVDFTNNLPEPTNIHWHGVDVPANMDGSNISQVAVPPGGQFRYQFDLTREGLFWYHPHENTNEQVERGLHGALLVKGPRRRQRQHPAASRHDLVRRRHPAGPDRPDRPPSRRTCPTRCPRRYGPRRSPTVARATRSSSTGVSTRSCAWSTAGPCACGSSTPPTVATCGSRRARGCA